MALIVEDGTGLANAESYASVAEAVAYAARRNLTFSDSDTAAAEGSLVRATEWLDGKYRGQFLGYRVKGRSQALEWPRSGANTEQGYFNEVIDYQSVPAEVKRATIEAAVRELAVPGSLSPDIVAGKIIESVSVSGAVSVKYKAAGIQDMRPTMTVISGILAPVLGSYSALVGSSSRG